MTRLAVLLASLAATDALVVGAAPRTIGRPLAPPPLPRGARADVPLVMRDDDEIDRPFGSTEDFGQQRRIEKLVYTVGGAITIIVPVVLGIWAYNEGYLTPQ